MMQSPLFRAGALRAAAEILVGVDRFFRTVRRGDDHFPGHGDVSSEEIGGWGFAGLCEYSATQRLQDERISDLVNGNGLSLAELHFMEIQDHNNINDNGPI